MRTSPLTLTALRARAAQLGFDDVGVCSAEPFEHWRQAAPEGLKNRLHADPREIMPQARAIIVAVRRYDAYEPWPDGHAQLTQYYTQSTDSRDRTEELAQWLREQGYAALADPALPHRAAALRVGFGCQGWNQQFCHDELGVLVSLDLVLTDAPFDMQDAPYRTCEGCGLCVQACPTGALSEGGGFDRPLCLRHHMIGIETVPLDLREKMGSRLLGCAECTSACPHAHAGQLHVPEELLQACGLEAVLRAEPAAMETLRQAIGANYARKRRLQAHAALCAGNSADQRLVPALSELLQQHPATNARCHSAWALGALGGPQALQALREALQSETDDAVRQEICRALARLED